MSLGLYFHIPYCKKKCAYCDFNSYATHAIDDTYVQSIMTELEWKTRLFGLKSSKLYTVYIGGGTPSLLNVNDINNLMTLVRQLFDVSELSEVTIEVNPASIDKKKLAAFRAAGVNRLSIGAQSFIAKNLKFLGRIHDESAVYQTVSSARGVGFDNISIDLIFAIADQTMDALLFDLEQALSLAPEHISLYLLSIEENTDLKRAFDKGLFKQPDDMAQERMFIFATDYLESNGYQRYETSNFAKRGFESAHNMSYWKGVSYLGIGAGAHSFLNDMGWGARYANIKKPDEYIAAIRTGQIPVQNLEILSRSNSVYETVYTHLRTRDGLDGHVIRQKFGVDPYDVINKSAVKALTDKRVEIHENGIRLTKHGSFLADEIFATILY